MSLAAKIENLPTPKRVGRHYTTHILSAYLRLVNPAKIREDVALHGYYLAKGENEEHEAITLEKLKEKFKIVLDGIVETRKNSWSNRLNYNLNTGNDKAVGSMITSIWRRFLGETSSTKARKSAYGYAMNGNQRAKTKREKEIKALCEYCHQEITVPLEKGFTCPCCGVYFHNFKPQKVKIKKDFEIFYVEDFEEKSTFQKIQTGEFEFKKTKKANTGQLAFSFSFGMGV